MNIVTGNTEFFKGIDQIKYEGNETDNPLAFRWYDENKVIAGKTMKEHLRFSCAYWHSFEIMVQTHLAKAHMLLPGIRKRMLLKEQKIKWMQRLNSLPK